MKISFKCDYALKIIFDLSLNYNRSPEINHYVKMKDIAKRQNIPFKYLQQIVLFLKCSGYIHTTPGIKGGICLAKSPEDITLGEIIRLMEGTTSPIACVNELSSAFCRDKLTCVFRPLWRETKKKIDEIVNNVTFANLVERHYRVQKKQTYFI